MQSNFDATGAQFGWDSTTLKAATTCLRLYYLSFIENFQDSSPKADLVFGGHYAKALERYHKLVAFGASHNDALLSVVKQVMIETWVHNTDKKGNPLSGTGVPQQFLHATKTRENLIRTIVWYLEENLLIDNNGIKTYVDGQGNPAVERSFIVELNDDIVYSGHIDRIVAYDDHVFVQDQKTTGSTVSTNYFQKYDLDIQMSGYTYASRIALAPNVKGVMIDAAQIAVGFSRFQRGFTYRTEAQLNEWFSVSLNTINLAREVTKRWRDTDNIDWFVPNFTACGNYGGCPFAEICSKPPSLRKQFLTSNYSRRHHPWNPLESR